MTSGSYLHQCSLMLLPHFSQEAATMGLHQMVMLRFAVSLGSAYTWTWRSCYQLECVTSRDDRVATKLANEHASLYALRTISASSEFMMLGKSQRPSFAPVYLFIFTIWQTPWVTTSTDCLYSHTWYPKEKERNARIWTYLHSRHQHAFTLNARIIWM